MGLGGAFQPTQGLLVRLLHVGTPEDLEGPARFVEHGSGRLGHVEEQPAPFCGILGLTKEFLRGGDESFSIFCLGVQRCQGGERRRLLGLDFDRPFKGADGLLGIVQAIAVDASDLQGPHDSFFGIRGEVQLPFRHARYARPIVASLGHPAQGLVCLHAGGIEIADDVFQRSHRLGRIIQLLDQQAGALERQGNGFGRTGRNGATARQQVGQSTPVGLLRRNGG